MVKYCRKKDSRSKLVVICFTELVYVIWCNRNSCIFRSHSGTFDDIIRDILFRVASRCHVDVKGMLPNMALSLVNDG